MVVSVSVVHPLDSGAAWELHCPAQDHRRVCTAHLLRERPKFKIQTEFLVNVYHFCTILRSKNPKLKPSLSQVSSAYTSKICIFCLKSIGLVKECTWRLVIHPYLL